MRKSKLDPNQSARVLGYASQRASDLPEAIRVIRGSAGALTSKRKPSLPPMPWDKETSDDKAK
jgi:hypothetical protein